MTTPPDTSKNLSLNRQLLDAAVQGDLAHVKKLLDAGAETYISRDDVSEGTAAWQNGLDRDSLGIFQLISLHTGQNRLNAAMYLAAFHGEEKIVDYFLDRSAYDPMTLKVALFGAARAGALPLVQKLVDAGADATFKDDYPLRESLARGHDAVAIYLAAKTPCGDRALGYAIEKARIDMAAGFLSAEVDLKPAIARVAYALGAARAPLENARRQRDTVAIQDGFHMLLSFAQARGDNMQDLLRDAADQARAQEARPLIEAVLDYDGFEALPDKGAILTPLLTEKIPPDTTAEEHAAFMVKLVQKGAAPQQALNVGVLLQSADLVDEALRHRADPRRQKGAALMVARAKMDSLKTPESQLIFGDMLAIEALFMVMDENIFSKGQQAENALQSWRQTDADRAGVTGIMSGFAIGKAAEIFSAAEKAGTVLTPADLLQCDAQGYRALDCLEDAGDLGLLYAPKRWQGRAADYQVVWNAMTPSQQKSQALAHAELIQRFVSDEGLKRLRSFAAEHKKKLRPPSP